METENKTLNQYDRQLGALHGLPDVVFTKPSTLRVIPPLGIGGTYLYSVQTFRQKDVGDTVFLEHGSSEGYIRLVIPPAVADAIARQREQLTAKVRSRNGRLIAEERKRLGLQPGFMRKKGARS